MGKISLTEKKMPPKGKAPAQPKKFRASDYTRPGLNEDEVDEIKEAFDLFDSDGSGEIEFGEFLDVMTAKLSEKNTREEIDRVFKLFDKDRNGTLEADDLSRVCKELGEDMTEEDIREVIGRMDVDGDGAVGLDDFYAVITKKTFE